MLFSRSVFGCGSILLLLLAACGSSGDAKQSSSSGAATTSSGSTSAGAGGASTTSTTSTGMGGAATTATTGTTSTGTTTGSGGQGGSVPAVPAQPQVVNLGGTVIAAAKIQLIAYTEDPMEPAVEGFITEFGATTEWAAQTSEYGVGPFTQLPAILIPGTPPTMLDDNAEVGSPFQQTLAANVSGANPVWGAEDGSTIYVFLLPEGTNISSFGSCCSDFLGYHFEAAIGDGSTNAPYGVVCDCGVVQGIPLTATQWITTTVSHEMVEAATDPYSHTGPAWVQTDDDDAIWTIATGGEIADMCEYNTDSNYTPPGSTYMLQRSWSNAAAKAGTDPCVPVPENGPYFNSYAVFSDPITFQYGGPWDTKGVHIAVGESKTIPVVLHSQSPTAGPWTIKAWDLENYLTGAAGNTTVSLNKDVGSDGDVLQLTIKVNSYDADFGGAGFILESDLNGQDNLTIGAVGE
jgi:hypothetical protein